MNIVPKIKSEVIITTARAGGSGGQHVNKVETKVLLRWPVKNSDKISARIKSIILKRLSHYITQDGDLLITEESSRSQHTNKERAWKKLEKLLNKALKPKKIRKKTAPSKASKEARLQRKKRRGELKKQRGQIRL